MTVSNEKASAMLGRRSGWLLKGSDVVNGYTCRRFAVLSEDSFETYRQDTDPKPSAVWPLHPKCEVTPLDARELMVRAKGRSTLVAMVAGKCERVDGFCFSVLWPQTHFTKNTRLVLGFESETTAAKWQSAFLESIQNLSSPLKHQLGQQDRAIRDSPAHTESAEAQTFHEVPKLDKLPDFPSGKTSDSVEEAVQIEPRGIEVVSAGESQDQDRNQQDLRLASSSQCTTSSNGEVQAAAPQQSGQTQCYWYPWKHVNGIAVYREEDHGGGGGAFMVSTIVRSPPSVCFKALMGNSMHRTGVSGFFDMEILEEIDDNVQIVHARIEATSWVGSLLAPRDIVAERSWRLEEEDGTYVVLLQSTDKFVATDEQSQEGWFSWFKKPVRANIPAAGFTIAPLQEKYCGGGESPESLVTMVLNVDLGGVCGKESFLGPFCDMIGVREAWIQAMLMTVVNVKDRVEQSRFVTLPFTVGSAMSSQPRRTTTALFNSPGELKLLDNLEPYKVHATPAGEEKMDKPGSPKAISPRNWQSGTLDPQYWSCPGAAGFKVRGKNYLQDRKKILAGEPVYELRSVDLVEVDQPTPHIARYLKSIRCSTAAFTFLVQIMVPGPPHLGLVLAWAPREESTLSGAGLDSGASNPSESEQDPTPFEMALMRFVAGDDELRDNTFKLIPHIVKGSWIVRQSVGSTPVLLGRKLKQHYFKGPRYIEVDINVGSSYTAASVVGLVSGATRSLCVDLAIVMEGKSEKELPEALLGTVQLDRLDLTTAEKLDTSVDLDPEVDPNDPED